MTADGPDRAPAGEVANEVASEISTEAGRPLIERIGLGAIAVVLAAVFAFVTVAAWTSGELFLAVMAGIGALMTVWAAAATLRRG